MAASNTPCPSSPSESDSDREPNSSGARVFWGNLRTPETSRSAFVDPPQTVVRTQRASHTQTTRKFTGLSIPVQENRFSPDISPMMEEHGDPLTATHLNNNTMNGLAPTQEQCNDELQFRSSFNDDNDTTDQAHHSLTPQEPHVSLQLSPMVVPSLADSESEIDWQPALQPSSPVNALSPQDLFAHEPSGVASLSPLSVTHTVAPPSQPPVMADTHAPQAPELPDLISFDMPTSPRHSNPENQSHASPHPALTPSSQLSSTSSNATVDELLTLSPVQSKSPSQTKFPSPDLGSPDVHVDNLSEEVVATDCLANLEPQVSHQIGISSDAGCCTSRILANGNSIPSPTVSPPPTNDSVALPLQTGGGSPHDTFTDNPCTAEDRPATPSFKDPGDTVATPKQVLGSTSQGQTRKRSPLKESKGKEKAHDDDDTSTESSNNAARESPEPASNGDESASDRAAIRERRAKVKREAERTRQQLLSLSPTSANVLSLLASPDRDSSTRPFSSIGLDEAISGLAVNSHLSNGSSHAATVTPQMTPARRVPISASPRRAKSPLHFIVPSPVKLNDPNRTPARRILVSPDPTPRPLPLDDPNRMSARRVVVQSSPAKPEHMDFPAPLMRIEGSSPLKQTMTSLSKSPSQPASKSHDNAATLPSVSKSQTKGVPRPLPFPIRKNVAGVSTNAMTTGARTIRPNTESGTARQQASVSILRQAPSISTSKIARIATKPYSRPAHAPSRLPVTSALRGANSAATTNSAGPSKSRLSPAVAAPSRIPSPSKRSVPSVKSQTDGSQAMPTTAPSSVNNNEDKARVLTTYKRKRQRMISEDDPDEPPAKRAVIMVRPVIKGMYNKASATNSDAADSTMMQREASPVRPARPPGPIQVRPVIPGTLRHFETSRSSSRDILSDAEMESNSDIQATAAGGSSADVVVQPPAESRESSPLVDTDNASTVTTLSREPTLEELPDSSVPRSDTPVPAEVGPELRRTTRFRKPSGPDSLGMPSVSTPANRREPLSLTRTTSMIQQEASLLSSKGSSRSASRTGMVLPEGLPSNPKQLQALTDANTLRNQTCSADLQRKVVRRHGPRPASPSSKVRTMNEKLRGGRAKEREARAERRRRRDLGSNVSTSSEGDDDTRSSPTLEKQTSEGVPPAKHARGPGDEEDYETPARPPKPSLLDPKKVTKTVKWDRGLARTISEWAAKQLANEAHERGKSESDPVGKGCLVRDRTTLRLDPLGNVPDANVPLDDLGRERIVITRFVYDDDIEATRTVKKKKT